VVVPELVSSPVGWELGLEGSSPVGWALGLEGSSPLEWGLGLEGYTNAHRSPCTQPRRCCTSRHLQRSFRTHCPSNIDQTSGSGLACAIRKQKWQAEKSKRTMSSPASCSESSKRDDKWVFRIS